jgi:N-acetylglucosamine malate deacetylase 1
MTMAMRPDASKRTKASASKASPLPEYGLDFMAIGAHADDCEIFAGGTIAKLVAAGRKGLLVDLTDASAGTRGTPEQRLREAAAAAKSLNITRVNLGFPDGRLEANLANQNPLIAIIRKHRPKVLLTHGAYEDHPDHLAAHQLVAGAAFRAGLAKLPVAGEAYRPQRIFHWVGLEPPQPTFAVDVTETWPAKLKAIRCYVSQFHGPEMENFKGRTDLATPAFLEALEYRARYFGARIKRRYAEAFSCHELAEVVDITALGGARFP